jgi:hypothetical protein
MPSGVQPRPLRRARRPKAKCYRIDGNPTPGPDYVCSKCGAKGLRLWRDAGFFLWKIRLLCATCATRDQAKEIASYAKLGIGNEDACTIGDLIPARPNPEGDTFWGHTSGDAAVLARERDHFVRRYQGALADKLELYDKIAKLERKAARR